VSVIGNAEEFFGKGVNNILEQTKSGQVVKEIKIEDGKVKVVLCRSSS